MKLDDFEISVVRYCNKGNWGKVGNRISELISNVHVLTIVWIVIIDAILFFDHSRARLVISGIIAVFSIHLVITELLMKHGGKLLGLSRKRPYMVIAEIRPVGKPFSDSSFPSSHMASVVGGLVVLGHFYPVLLAPLVLFAILLGFSRLHNGMHYPSDIITGTLLGLAYGTLSLQLIKLAFL